MTSEDFAALRARVEAQVQKDAPGNLPEAYRAAGMSHKRYRWDVLWRCKAGDIVLPMYRYLNDDHIDTALRSILGADYTEGKS